MTEPTLFRHVPPGPLLDQLVAEVLAGAKTATSAPLDDVEASGYRPAVGERIPVVGSSGEVAAIVALTDVVVARMREITDATAVAEGTLFPDAATFVDRHLAAWTRDIAGFRTRIGDPAWTPGLDTLVVTRHFRVVPA